MKALKIVLVVLVVLVVVALVAASFLMKDVVKKSVPVLGQKTLKVPVSLGNLDFSLFRGAIRLDDLVIGNPSGFNTDHAFKVKTIAVDWEPRSVLTKKIVIKNITVDSPDIIFEQGLSGNNFSKIMDNLKKPDEAKKEPAAEAPTDSGQGEKTKVVIDLFLIKNGTIKLSMPGMGSAAAPIPLPEVRLTDIGKESGGASPADVMTKIFDALFESLTKAVMSAGGIIGKGLGSAGSAAVEGVQTVGTAAKDTVSAAGGAAKDAVGAAGETATKAVGELKGLLGQ